MQTPETPSPDHVAAHVAGKAGRISLIRADALNALSHEMCLVIKEILLAWRENLQVEVIMIDAEGSKAFCAGATRCWPVSVAYRSPDGCC
jgi:enoyl-CoA hydratase